MCDIWTECEAVASSYIQDHVKVLIQQYEEDKFRVVAINSGSKRLVHVKWHILISEPSEARIIVPSRTIVKTTSNWKTPTGGSYIVYDEGDQQSEVYFHLPRAFEPEFDLDVDADTPDADGQVKFRIWLPSKQPRNITLQATLRAIPDIEGETIPVTDTFTASV